MVSAGRVSWLVAVAGALGSVPLPGQNPAGGAAVRGLVVTESDQPAAFAVVELRTRKDSAALRVSRSDETGRFQLDSLAAGVYHLVIRSIGFAPAVTPDFTVVADQVRDLGRIRLQMTAVQLDPVEVIVERPDVVIQPDRTGYLVEALTNTAGGVITDILREIPDVMVDIDGTIRFRGGSPAIFLNGRPAPMQGGSLTVFLEQFPADRIERIEVLEHPPARYASEGSGAIINIVLRQGVELGLTGSASLSAGTRHQYTGSARATLQRGRLVANAGLNGRWGDSRNADFTLRQNLLADPVTYLEQDSRSDRSNRNGGVQLEVRYNLSPQSRLTGRFFGNLNGSDRDGFTATAHLDELRLPTLRYDRLSRQDGNGGSADARVGFQRIWEEDRHEFEIELTAQRGTNRNRTREEIAADSVFREDELLPPWLTLRDDGSRNTGVTAEFSYTHPWSRQGRVELGSSFGGNRSIEDQSTGLFEETDAPIPDIRDERLITRDQRLGAAHLTVQRRIGKIGIVMGLRGEWLAEEIRLPGGGLLDRDDTYLFPTASLNWNPRPRMGLRLGFSQRVNRPGVSILDPTNRSTDPLNRVVGNPEIKAATSRSITLGFSWGGRRGQLALGPYWNRTTDGWERVTTVDSAGVSTSTWANLTSRTSMGASLSYGLAPIRGWNARANLSASRTTLSGSLVSQGMGEGELRWSVGASFSGPVVRGILAQGTFGYEPGRDLVQGRTSGQWRADFSFRYRLMNNRTSIGIAVQDPFALRKTSQQIRDPSVIQTGRSRVTTRSMSLNISYAFGGGRGPTDGR